ncbi:MAG: TRAP transporter substrate-binding protein, partial [Pseudomonadota bacterium]
GALRFARALEQNSGGRLSIRVFGDGELVPALEVFDSVSRGTADLGHGTPAYWRGKLPASQFFNGIPFGMTLRMYNAWLYHEGGWDLWRDIYEPFNLIPVASGNTDTQMGGWFRDELNSVGDLKGLKMRIAGFGGEVFARVGGTPVLTAGSEILTSLQTGNIDAAEFSGPYNDQAFGFHQVAKHYYYPGWHEPTGMVETLVNKQSYEKLPEDLQAIVIATAMAENTYLTSEFYARNVHALRQLTQEHGVRVKRFPESIMSALQNATKDILAELAASDASVKRVLTSYAAFQQSAQAWEEMSRV